MKRYGVRLSLSLRLSVPAWANSSKPASASLLRLLHLLLGEQEISTDCCSSGGRMRAVPRCRTVVHGLG